jgi:hypothetical protein
MLPRVTITSRARSLPYGPGMSHTDAVADIWADHLRRRAEVPAAYGRPDRAMLLTLPGGSLRPLAAALESHRRILRLATDERRRRGRATPRPAPRRFVVPEESMISLHMIVS